MKKKIDYFIFRLQSKKKVVHDGSGHRSDFSTILCMSIKKISQTIFVKSEFYIRHFMQNIFVQKDFLIVQPKNGMQF